jgi:hypothetical protein
VAIGIFVANPPIGNFQSLLLGNATIAPFNNPAKSIDERAAKTSRWAPRGETGPGEEIKRVRTRPARLRLIARKLFGTLRTEVTPSLRSRLDRNRLRVQRAG